MPLDYSPGLTISGIPAWIHHGTDGSEPGISEAWPSEGPTAEATFKCYWEDRYDLAKALMGSSEYVNDVLIRTNPFQWPESPNLFCQSLGSIVPLGTETLQEETGLAPAGWVRAATWPDGNRYALVPARFGVAPFGFSGPSEGIGLEDGDPGGGPNEIQDASGQAWTTTTFNFNGESYVPPNGTYYYDDNSSTPAVPVHDSLIGIVRPKVEIGITRHQVPRLRLAKIAEFIGKCNANNVRFRDYTFQPGYLLFSGFRATRSVDVSGRVQHSVEYGVLGQTDHPWNQLQGQDGDWHLVNTKADYTGDPIFSSADFRYIP